MAAINESSLSAEGPGGPAQGQGQGGPLQPGPLQEGPEVAGLDPERKRAGFRFFLKRLLRSKTGTVGAVLVLIVCLTALLAPLLAGHDPAAVDPLNRLKPPMWLEGGTKEHWLGTDNLGRDMWSRIVYGSRVSLIVGIGAVLVSGAIGAVLGLVSGFYGKWIDAVIMRVADGFMAIPTILFMLVVMAVVGPGLTTLIFVIGVTNWVSYTRVVRGEVLSIKERDFVKAAKAVGAKNGRIILKHILPNILSSFIVISGMNVATTIIMEASLSFLGLGIKPPDVSWGGMLSDGRQYVATSWWVATFPGLAITVTVLGVIFLGDWLRDVLDPRMKTKA
ncbi:oligopeptide ABC transporter permease [Paenibacillus macerans]|uniref:Binding--dependent transport system inner membrane component family protein n=2 Tax=Paenibacillus macerans TaxID=44252 RepID=A0A090Z5J5_PAEMA|nr:binding--dependent transport system inner membrane component family protein [Paenibacillus macerans]SUA85304.1 oligopeptide ABC transporter permease [Paenibacillus macerans]